ATTNHQQVAQAILRGTLGRFGKSSPSRASARFSPLNWSCRSKPWRASCLINTACLCLATAAGTWFGKSPGGDWWPASADAPSGAGWMRTPSGLGSTAVGFSLAIRTFKSRPSGWLDLYQGLWNDQALGDDDYIVSADEKTSIQARIRLHPTVPPQPQQSMRVEFEYERGGALAYLAAWDVRRAKVFGRCETTTGIEPFDRLVQQVMEQEPYRTAHRVFWIVDNGSSHRGAAAVRRLQGKYSNLILVHLPVHASWLNQVEIYFSVVQRKVLTPNDFASLAQVADRLTAFHPFYEQIAQPFEWKFTRADLRELI